MEGVIGFMLFVFGVLLYFFIGSVIYHASLEEEEDDDEDIKAAIYLWPLILPMWLGEIVVRKFRGK